MAIERIGQIGNTFEFSKSGKRLAGTDKMTFDEMLEYSISWPATYHRWDGCQEHRTRWAHAGREMQAADLPAAIR